MPVRPTLYVTRKLPAQVEARLARDYTATLVGQETPRSREELAAALATHDAILPTITDRLDAELLSAPGIKARIIANFGAGVEHIALDAARAAGLTVTNTPDALTDATADIAMLLILMTCRRAGEGERQARAGNWPGWHPVHLLGQSLAGKTLGLVGYGRIARATARRAAAFGMQVLHHSRTDCGEPGFIANLDDLAAQADVLSLHTPGGTATKHLINAARLTWMKPGAILINTARGSLVDEDALADALELGHLAAAGLDVHEHEPALHPRLLASERTVLLPHLGSATIEARTAMGMQAADNLDAFFAGKPAPNRVA